MKQYFTSGQFIETLFVFFIGIAILIGTTALDDKILKSKSANAKWYKSAKMIIDFAKYVVMLLLFLAILSINGINVEKYMASLGIMGVVLTFALQDLLKDITMGLSIMFEGYFKVGDMVVYNGELAKVVSFTIKTTKLMMDADGSIRSVGNRNISDISVASDFIDILVPVGYDVDVHFARSLCRECTKRIERLRYVYSCEFLNTQELAESWVEYKLRIHCLPEKKTPVRRNAIAVVQDVFYEHEQGFPYSVKIFYDGDKAQAALALEKPERVRYQEKVAGSQSEQLRRKLDYELGKGADKSKECRFDGTSQELDKAIAEADRYTRSENLGKAMRLRIRLLTEELLTLVSGIEQMKIGTFYIERDGGDYDICYEAVTHLNRETKELLNDMTGDKKTGFGAMISNAISSMAEMSNNDRKGISSENVSAMSESIGKDSGNYKWSYNIFREKEIESAEESGETSAYINEDEIGKSMITRLSDDIRITMKSNKVSMRILVKSEDDEEI